MIERRCDRRLSRAARELVRWHLVEAWKEAYTVTGATEFDLDVTEWNIWQLLDATLVVPTDSYNETDMICPLLSALDVYKLHEQSSTTLDGTVLGTIRNAAIPGSLHTGRKRNRPIQPVLHRCDLCNKIFTSLFYMDKHFDEKHGMDDSMYLSNDLVCPAVTYCKFLSDTACYDQAMLTEPYYGQGSDGYGSDHHTVKHKLLQLQPVCNELHQQSAIIHCHEIVDVCFDGVLEQILSANMCSKIQSCHQGRLLHNLIGSSSHMIHLDQWSETWSTVYQAYHVRWLGLAIVLSVFVGHCGYWWKPTLNSVPVRRRTIRKSLLRNTGTSVWPTKVPTTLIDYRKKGKRN
jgi:hypothetical protein